MTLPFDICTSLWLTSIPKWEWEPEPESCSDAPPPAEEGAPAIDGATFAALPAPPPPPATNDSAKPGFRLVFKGFEMAGKVYWLPADSPVSRPWVARVDDAARRHRPDADVPPKPEPDATDPKPDWEHP